MKHSNLYPVAIATLAALLFIPFLGSVHLFDWDEINFAECAREMIVTHKFNIIQINFQAFWEKPPIFIWMQAISMLVFGVNEFAARFPNALCGIVTLLTLFSIGKRTRDERFGLFWCLAYAGSMLPHFYFKSGIIDPWFNLFIFLGMYYVIRYTSGELSGKNAALSALFIGLAVLTKGPVALLIFGLSTSTYLVLSRFKTQIRIKDIAFFTITFLIVGASWFLWLIASGHANVVGDFLTYQVRLFRTEDAGHGGPFYYHAVILFIGCFPASIFAIRSMRKTSDTASHDHFRKWMLILLWVVLILFSIVQTKIVHYSSFCYFPITWLAANTLYKLRSGEIKWNGWMSAGLITVALIIGTLLSSLQFIGQYKDDILRSGFIHDRFAAENLNASVQWSGYEFLIGVFFFVGVSIAAIVASRRKSMVVLFAPFVLMILTTDLTAFILAPKIEGYSQRAAIDFYEEHSNEDCYLKTLDFKSYAFMFYGKTKETEDTQFMLEGAITKPAYFVCKINDADRIEREHTTLTELGRKNGFVFLVRRSQ